MINIVIDTKTTILAKVIINEIIGKNCNLRLVGISNNMNELRKIILNYNVDFLITTNEYYFKLMEKIIYKITKLPYTAFVTYEWKENFENSRVMYLDRKLKINDVLKGINLQIESLQKQDKKECAINILLELGFNFKMRGTTYLLNSILYLNFNKTAISFEFLERDVYAHIGKMYNIRAENVKWAINRAVANMYKKYNESNYSKIEKYFYVEYPKKPTTKLIIILISNII